MILENWEAIQQAGPQQVGGKAWNLARLVRYGLTVPPGRVIVVDAYRHWLDTSRLKTELLAAAGKPQGERTDALAAVADKLARIPSGIELGRLPDEPSAVRSSALHEDSATASFAGIHSSCLNVRGEAAMEKAILKVWLSLWSPTAVAYRERIGLAHDDAEMAVLIMPLIAARVSGIGFTRDPRSGRDDRMVIQAGHGLGESLVSGETPGDEIILAEDLSDYSLKVLQVKPGDKSIRVDAKSGGGTSTHRLTADYTPALSETEALQLGEQMRLAAFALDYTRPDFDLEWAWDDKGLWLLQARPITAVNRCTYPELVSQPDLWTRGNTRDVVPDPLSPFDWGASRRMVNAILKEGFQLAGLRLQPGVQRAGLFHGRLYINLSLLQWEGYASIGIKPEAMNRLIGGYQPSIQLPEKHQRQWRQILNLSRYLVKSPARLRAGRKEVKEVMEQVTQWKAEPLPMSDEDFARTLSKMTRFSSTAYNLFFLQGSASGALSFLVDTIEARLPGQGHSLAAALMAGGPASVTAQMGYDLVTLAKQAVADPFTRQWLEQRRENGGDWQALSESNPLRQSFTAFLQHYGHRGIYETYTRNPRWHEQADYLLDNLVELAETDLQAQERTQREARITARGKVKQALAWWKRPLLDGMISAAKRGSNEREAARSAMIAMLDPVRQVLLALGERWVDAGWLEMRDEIFFLLQHEIIAVLEKALPGEALLPLVADRRRQFESFLAEEAADVILQHPDGSQREQVETAVTEQAGGDCFMGIPVGTGLTKGIARILHSPEEGGRLKQDEILVAPSTDPAWTPLFFRVGGLVMETGGYLSHGAIVAREFGIPAVVNLPGILQKLHDGDRIEVDGGKGRVRRLNG